MVNEQGPNATGQPVSGKRIMALDLGEKRIGVALSDETHLIARSYTVLERTSRRADFAQIGDIVAENNVGFLVVGLPVKLSGEEGPIAAWVRDYTAELSEQIGLDYALWDESFTTQQASDSMRQRGRRAKEQRDWIDAVAAAFILQDFLDARRDRASLL
jgi:putative Holliday junction resolvase